jgi:ribonuclease P protein component
MLDEQEAEKNSVLKFRDFKLLNSLDFKGNFYTFELNNCVKVKYRKNSLNHSRIGFVIPKKFVKLAVTRNYIRRKIRFLFLNFLKNECFDVIFTIKKNVNKNNAVIITNDFKVFVNFTKNNY